VQSALSRRHRPGSRPGGPTQSACCCEACESQPRLRKSSSYAVPFMVRPSTCEVERSCGCSISPE
jgi:hypothetical protein